MIIWSSGCQKKKRREKKNLPNHHVLHSLPVITSITLTPIPCLLGYMDGGTEFNF